MHIYITVQKFGDGKIFLCFWKKSFILKLKMKILSILSLITHPYVAPNL